MPGFDDIEPEQMLSSPRVGERLAEVLADWAAVDPATAVGPLLVVQGEADTSAFPPFTAELVDELCSSSVDVEYRTYVGAGHDAVLAAAADDVAGWLAARFAGEPFAGHCGTS